MTTYRIVPIWFCLFIVTLTACGNPSEPPPPPKIEATAIDASRPDWTQVVAQARRIPNAAGWFEILALPNDVYAFWEPGHSDSVNAFLILGSQRNVLYDTGMGIASIAAAVDEVRRAENLPNRELMVINSHNHLDHNGGNREFKEAWIIKDEWAIRKLTEGIAAGEEGGFVAYWQALSPHPGVRPPGDYNPETFSIPPFPRENIRFLAHGDTVDLGNRQFRVIHTISHSPDGLALYDPGNKILFGGDTFVGDRFLSRDLSLLAEDLESASQLAVAWHYSSHGPQLIDVMRSGHQLSLVRRMIGGERTESETTFAGQVFPLYELEDVQVILAGEFLTY